MSFKFCAILLIFFLLSTVYAARSKPSRSRPSRSRPSRSKPSRPKPSRPEPSRPKPSRPKSSNECAAVDLSLSTTVVEFYATRNRISVGEVTLSTTAGNLITSISLVDGCTLVGDIQVDIFPGSTLKDVIPGKFPCKQRSSGSSSTLKCPVTYFSNIKDCCAESFLIAVHVVASCAGVHDVANEETAYAAKDPNKHRCTGRRGWCNFIPVNLTPACKPGCNGNIPFVEECVDNKCVKNPKDPCEDFCDGNGNPIQSVCDESSGSCDNTPKTPCINKCKHNTPISSTCKNGACEDEELDPCVGRCEGDTPIVSTCKNGVCDEEELDPCLDKCEGDTPVTSTCKDGTCDEEELDPCLDKCEGATPIVSTCKNGVCDEEELDPCLDKCEGDTPVTSACKNGACEEVSGDECTDECDGNTLITRECKDGSCTENESECGTCETCESTGTGVLTGLMCVKQTCGENERLNEDTCECCPVCGEKEFVAQNGCDCVPACDACPGGSVCSSFIDGDRNEVFFCRDCSCGYCLKGDDCCRPNPQSNCVPNRQDLPAGVQCQSSDYEMFPDTPNNDVCRGEEKVSEDLGMDFVNTCGCVPSREIACTFNPPDPSAKCFIERKDGMELA